MDDYVTGRLVTPADPTALTAAITELLDDPQCLRTMSLAARQRYESLYTPERNISQLLAVYKDAIQQVTFKHPTAPASVF